MNAEQAKSEIMKEAIENAPDGASPKDLDSLADNLLLRVAKFTGECLGHPDFCGFGIDEERDAQGSLLSLKLIPCDNVGGDAVRRLDRPRR